MLLKDATAKQIADLVAERGLYELVAVGILTIANLSVTVKNGSRVADALSAAMRALQQVGAAEYRDRQQNRLPMTGG